jgi:hypothetical protein
MTIKVSQIDGDEYAWSVCEEVIMDNRKHTKANLVRIDGATWRRMFAGDVKTGTMIRLHTEIVRSGFHIGYAPSRKVIRYSGSLSGPTTVWIRHEYKPRYTEAF